MTGDRAAVADLIDHLDQVQRRVVLDAFNEASRTFWLRRADDFAAALPRQSDFHGHEGLASVRRRRQRLEAIIFACRAKAEVALLQGGEDDLL